MGTDPVRVGIAGLGRAGWGLHALSLEQLPQQYRIVAVTDPESSRRQEAQERFGCRAYETFEALLEDEEVELVVVATPSVFHAEQSIAAMEAGKHVLCEKPFATTLEDADRMIETGRKTGRIVTSAQNYRYASDFLKVREILDSGVLGQVLTVKMNTHRFSRRWDWQTLKEFGGGELNNTAVHLIDQAVLLLGDREVEVFCHRMHTPLSSGDAEDHVKVVLKAKDGLLFDIEATMAAAYPQEKLLILATQGGLRVRGSRIEWKYFDPSQLPPRPVDRRPTPDRSYNREELPWVEEQYDVPPESFNLRNRRLYEDLYRTLREGAPLAITPESVRKQMWILQRCRELAPV
ncbi:MAG: hypothetical protein KatS3mg115_0244 [Candidatus Poribacteria bacterium]|nr:MAG: hypothetical protein KatS3mg115_0244 [Candidatus Poribacteria bacterium]